MAAEEDDNTGLWGAIGVGLLSGILGSQGQKEANETNLQLGREQMQFQERMSGTAYQRAIRDMAAAGINPMLVSQVGGATSPSGAMPQVQNALGAGVSSAQQGMAMAQQYQAIQQSQAQEDQLAAQADRTKAETVNNALHTAKLAADVDQTKASEKNLANTAFNASLMAKGISYDSMTKEAQFTEMHHADDKGRLDAGFKADVDKRKAEAAKAQFELKKEKAYSDYYDSPAGKAEPYIGLGTDVISSAAGVRRAFGPQRTTNIYRRK